MFGATEGSVIDVGKLGGSTSRNSCGSWKVRFTPVVLNVTRALPWNWKMPLMSDSALRLSPGAPGPVPAPISSVKVPAMPGRAVMDSDVVAVFASLRLTRVAMTKLVPSVRVMLTTPALAEAEKPGWALRAAAIAVAAASRLAAVVPFSVTVTVP